MKSRRISARSELPGAERFESWIFDEVLPTIRRTGQYKTGVAEQEGNSLKKALAEAQLNNSRARLSSVWLKIAGMVSVPEYKEICASYASAVLAGREVLPLPEAPERTYTAEEVGRMLGGLSANRVGRIANQHGLKVPEYGKQVWDKSPNSPKQVATWRYNDRAVEKLKGLVP